MTAVDGPPETFLQRQLRKKAEKEAAERPAPQSSGANALSVTADDPRARRWVEAKVAAQLHRLRSAQEGTRNATLFSVAVSLGQRIPAYLDEDHITEQLTLAAREIGLEPRETDLTIRSGLTKGKSDPLPVMLTDRDDLADLVPPGTPSSTTPRVNEATGEIDAVGEVVSQEGDETPPSTWLPLDLAPYLDGTHVPEKPALLRRSDHEATIYPGRVHWCSGEPEAMKSWLALLGCAQALHNGLAVTYIDLEDGASGITSRLLAMGVGPEALLSRFHYIAPHEPLRLITREALKPLVAGCALLVVDACTESLSLQQLSPKDDVDVASWLALLPRWATRQGCAVLVLDHVVKDTESRGRWATGSQHKLAGLDGVAFTLEAVQPGGKGMRGRSRLFVSKDRHGEVRPHTVTTAGNKQWLGDLVVDSTGAFTDVVLHPPTEEVGEFRPTVLMERVAAVLAKLGRQMTGKEIEDRVKGRAGDIRKAVACLVDDGFVTTETGARGARLHRLIKPYPPEQEES